MIFRRKKNQEDDDYEDEDDLLDDEFDDEEEEELETVLFQGATEGREVDLSENQALVRAALMPVKELISDAIDRRCERLVIEPRKGGSIVRLDIDGVGYAGDRYPVKQALGVTQMIKVLAGLDSKVRSKPQSGGIKAEFMGVPYRLRVESVPTQFGAERVIVKVRNMKERLDSASQLGITDELRQEIRKLTNQNRGIFLVCGPPGAGVTRTLHGSILCVDLYLTTVFNLQPSLATEEVPGLSNYDWQSEMSFAENIVRAQRKEADGVLVDPIESEEQAKQYFKNCDKMTFFTEMKAPNAAMAIERLVKLVGDPKLVADKLLGVLCPRLIRKLRDDIKEAYRPNPKLVAQLGLPPETNILYRPPSPIINDDDEEEEPQYEGLPYEGRTAVYEMIEINDAIRKLILSGADAKQIAQAAKAQGMPTHQQGAMGLVAHGITSLEEVRRAFKS
ncbi:MAG: secretion system protein E [Planctomyces sp.]|nr:secretion system protein E [Planctomyces sp.]